MGKIEVAIFWNPQRNKTQFCLLEDYVFYLPACPTFCFSYNFTEAFLKDEAITIPAGYVTDFASVPKCLWSLLPPIGKHNEAALVHDYLYDNKIGTRKRADDLFLAMMEDSNVHWLPRYVMYYGVRWFAKKWWDR